MQSGFCRFGFALLSALTLLTASAGQLLLREKELSALPVFVPLLLLFSVCRTAHFLNMLHLCGFHLFIIGGSPSDFAFCCFPALFSILPLCGFCSFLCCGSMLCVDPQHGVFFLFEFLIFASFF